MAFEIAKRLEADDEEISFLAGIDNPPDLRNLRVLEDFRKILSDVLPQLGVISEAQMKEFNAEHDENVCSSFFFSLLKKRNLHPSYSSQFLKTIADFYFLP